MKKKGKKGSTEVGIEVGFDLGDVVTLECRQRCCVECFGQVLLNDLIECAADVFGEQERVVCVCGQWEQ